MYTRREIRTRFVVLGGAVLSLCSPLLAGASAQTKVPKPPPKAWLIPTDSEIVTVFTQALTAIRDRAFGPLALAPVVGRSAFTSERLFQSRVPDAVLQQISSQSRVPVAPEPPSVNCVVPPVDLAGIPIPPNACRFSQEGTLAALELLQMSADSTMAYVDFYVQKKGEVVERSGFRVLMKQMAGRWRIIRIDGYLQS